MLTAVPATAPAVGALLLLLATLALALYLYATRDLDYWRRKGAPYLKPLPFVGNILDVVLFKKHYGEFLLELYNSMKSQRYLGIYVFDRPVLLIKDIDIWREVVHKDFAHFYDKGFTPSQYDTLMAEGLFSRKGKNWKDLRVKLGPAFTSGKLKRFYQLMEEKAQHLDTYFDNAARKGTPQDVVEATARFTTDVVSSIGFGIECSSLTDDNSHFWKLLRQSFTFSRMGVLKSLGWFTNVPLSRHWGCKLVPENLAKYVRHSIWETVRKRLETGTVGARGDFLDLLIELRQKGSIADDDGDGENKAEDLNTNISLEGDAFISQAWTFLAAGFETSSTTMSFALHHLARNQDVQDELRARLQSALADSGGKLTYEVLQSVAYLEMVILETLRLHPILPFLDRTCTKAYRVPGSHVEVDKGVVVMCSLLGVHTDPAYYPEPQRFEPRRFSEQERQRRPPCTFMPVGDGPRICIGMRLGLLQAKVGLAHIILNYKVRPRPEDNESSLTYNLQSFLLLPKDGVNLLISRV